MGRGVTVRQASPELDSELAAVPADQGVRQGHPRVQLGPLVKGNPLKG